MVTLDMRLRRNDEEVIGQVMDGEAILINLATGSYYAIPEVGACIWEAIDAQCSLGEVAVRLNVQYDVSLEQARADVLEFAARLMDEGIVAPTPDARSDHPAPAPPTHRAPYAAPQLTVYSDMRNLLALDPPMPSVDTLAGAARGGRSGSTES
jgi:hypothetical protein